MSIYFHRRCCHLSMSSRSPARGRRRTQVDSMLMMIRSPDKSRKTCRWCWWRPATRFPPETMQPIRTKRLLSLSNRGSHHQHWSSSRRFDCCGSPANCPVQPARLILHQSQWNARQAQHQPSTWSPPPLLSPNPDGRFSTIDPLREAWYWPNSIPLLVAFVFVISDLLVLLALVFHLVESSPVSLLPAPLIAPSPVSVDALILSSLPPCDQVAHPLAPDESETYGLQCLHPLFLSASPSDGTLISIWILDSALLCCAVLCRLIRTSSVWLRRPKSKFYHRSNSLAGDARSKSNSFSKCVGDGGEGQFNGDRTGSRDIINVRINANHRSLLHRDHNRIRRNGDKCHLTWCDWWSWLWPARNESPGFGRPDLFAQSHRRRTDRRGCLQWICAISQWQRRLNRTGADNGAGNDRLVNRRLGRRLPTASPPMLVANQEQTSRLTITIEHPLLTSLGRRRAVSKASSTLSSSCLVVVLLLSSFSSFAVSSSTPGPAFQSVPESPSSALAGDRLPMTDSLNPWLAADGGLILRAATGNTPNSSPLNWIRPNPGSCTPQPTIPACPSDRYCRLPETVGSFAVNGRPFPVTFGHRSSSLPTNSLNNSGGSSGGSKDDVQNGPPSRDPAKGNNARREGGEEEVERWSGRGVTADDGGSRNADAAVAKVSQCLPYLKPSSRSQETSDGDRDEGPSSAECICGHADGAKRVDTLRKYHLHHCYHYSLWHVLSDTMREGIAISRSQCYAYLEAVERLDNLAAHFVCQFEDIIRRYDCGQTFSSKSSCQKCKIAYRQWVCSMVLPMWLDGDRIKPCRTFCHEVERLCPYFLPAEKSGPGSQYAGEPSFLCIDPDVRETTNQSTNSAYSERSCYRPCTLEYNLEPDIDPSLCVASLGDISGFVEEDADVATDREDCQQTYKNDTASVSGIVTDSELLGDLDVSDDQCTPFSDKDPPLTGRLSSSGWTNHLHFGWQWRTLVLPFAMLPSVIQYFT